MNYILQNILLFVVLVLFSFSKDVTAHEIFGFINPLKSMQENFSLKKKDFAQLTYCNSKVQLGLVRVLGDAAYYQTMANFKEIHDIPLKIHSKRQEKLMETFVSEFVYFSYLSSGKDELFQSEIQSDLDSLQKMYSNNPILECDMPFFESFGLKIPPDFFKDHKLFRNVKEKAPAGLSAFKIEFNTITGAIGFVEMEQQAESLDLTSKGDWIPILEAYKEKFGAKAYEVGGIYGKYRLVGKMKGFNVDLGGGINKLNIKVSYRDRLFDLNLKNKVTVRAMLNPFYGSQILTEKANQLISKIVEFNTTKFKRSAKKMIKVGESDLVL